MENGGRHQEYQAYYDGNRTRASPQYDKDYRPSTSAYEVEAQSDRVSNHHYTIQKGRAVQGDQREIVYDKGSKELPFELNYQNVKIKQRPIEMGNDPPESSQHPTKGKQRLSSGDA